MCSSDLSFKEEADTETAAEAAKIGTEAAAETDTEVADEAETTVESC